MKLILSTNRTGDDYHFDSQVDSSEGGMEPIRAIHWGSGIIKRNSLVPREARELTTTSFFLIFTVVIVVDVFVVRKDQIISKLLMYLLLS